MARLRFIPQAWQNDYAIPVDAEGDTDFSVPSPLKMDGKYASDDYRDHKNAPAWVRGWHGPFEFEILRR